MRRFGLVVMTLTIVLAGLAVVHVGTTGEQRVFAQTVTVNDPWIGVWGAIDCDSGYANSDVQFGNQVFEHEGLPYYESVTFSIENAYPGLEATFLLQVHNRWEGEIVLQRKELSWSGDGPCMQVVSWQVNGQIGDPGELESNVLGPPVGPGETLSLVMVRMVSADVPQNFTCTERFVASIGPPPNPPSPPPAPAAFGGGFGGDPPCFFDVDMLGEVTRVYVTCSDSRCVQDYESEDPSGRQFLDLKQGTQVTHERDGQFFGSPPRWVRMRISGNPPPLPSGLVALSHVYDITGYTETGEPVSMVLFDRRVGMDLVYDPDDLPEDTIGIGIAYWNPATGQWQMLPQSTGRIAGVGTATADVTHFSKFAVLAHVPPEPAVGAPPTVTPKPASFRAEGLTISPAREHFWDFFRFLTRVGRAATVVVTIINAGETAGSYTADLMVNGELVTARQVGVAAGEHQKLEFVLDGLQEGVHRVEVGGLTGSFTTSMEVNWWLIALLAVLILAALYGALRWRRRFRSIQGPVE